MIRKSLKRDLKNGNKYNGIDGRNGRKGGKYNGIYGRSGRNGDKENRRYGRTGRNRYSENGSRSLSTWTQEKETLIKLLF
jgi:hypothetical protein